MERESRLERAAMTWIKAKTYEEILAEEDSIDLGSGACYKKSFDADGKWIAIDQYHKNSAGNLCCGWVPFQVESEHLTTHGPKWSVQSYEPLTMHPSLLCNCGHHGFIRNGRWEPC